MEETARMVWALRSVRMAIQLPRSKSSCIDNGTARTRHIVTLTPSHRRIEFLWNRREVSLFPGA
jgi:hypothetical protein